MVQHTKMDQCNMPHQQNEGKKTCNHLNQCRKNVLQNLTPFHDKNTQQTRIEGNYLNLIKALCEKPTVNIILCERLKVFPLRSGTRQ